MTSEIERIGACDHTQAEALRLAKAHLEKLGWGYTVTDIGKQAGVMLAALRAHLEQHHAKD